MKKKVGTKKACDALRVNVCSSLVWKKLELEGSLELWHCHRNDAGMRFDSSEIYESDLI